MLLAVPLPRSSCVPISSSTSKRIGHTCQNPHSTFAEHKRDGPLGAGLPACADWLPSHQGLRTDLDIPIRYNHNFIMDVSGSSGSSGSDGLNGTSGSMGSTDPNNPSRGGDGSNGQDGGAGGDAPPVQVRLTSSQGAR